jgi:hypothetical protein
VKPTLKPLFLTICAKSWVVVVFPFVPVTAIIGIRHVFLGGYNMSLMGAATFIGNPSEGARCIQNPRAALTSRITLPFFLSGCFKFSAMISTPHTSSPITLEILSARNIFSGCIISVTSTEVSPVLRLAVLVDGREIKDVNLTQIELGQPISISHLVTHVMSKDDTFNLDTYKMTIHSSQYI